ncbi:hypothetical protein [Pseudovibrio sp. Tun.PSC04-5.I4]|uniref:hypothetical protein n=1 Tax=Pseudovibrio sp. Tun.PSC04-5.I4 TaxID=1798213 RepID=UPI00088A266A|nr:hypothetical protein [Pseudovibrio sp. Tun.PSC04-5.I4]SDR30349.1 hypothetical protein SAMN04515695_4289 [Pseudovibrio sp. Tun.PSC04-5.I4]
MQNLRTANLPKKSLDQTSKFLRLFLVCVITTFAQSAGSLASESQSNKNCVSNETLLQKNMEEYVESPENTFLNGYICDAIGTMYVYGLKISLSPLKWLELDVGENYQFYYFIRSYLNNQQGSEHAANNAIMKGLTLATLSDKAALISEQRKNTYKTYLLKEIFYNSENAEKMTQGLLDSFTAIYAHDMPLEKWTQVNCFIKHDIPIFFTEKIMQSPSYQHCIEAKRAEQ